MRHRAIALALAFLVVGAGCVEVDLSTPAGPPTSASAGGVATVTHVVDGDTVELRFPDGETATARLLGVDTPEVHVAVAPGEYEGVPDTEAGRSCLREWGERASDHARERLLGERVRVTYDPDEGRRGGYGRLLVYVYADGALVNHGLVERGYARVYDSEFRKASRFYAAESAARADGAGLWTCRTPG